MSKVIGIRVHLLGDISTYTVDSFRACVLKKPLANKILEIRVYDSKRFEEFVDEIDFSSCTLLTVLDTTEPAFAEFLSIRYPDLLIKLLMPESEKQPLSKSRYWRFYDG